MSVRTESDVIVLGMGPGGEHVAGELASSGRDVIGIDAGLVGGECPYWGCIPSKMMLRAAHLLGEGRRIPGIAGRSEVTPDWTPVADRIRAEATDNWDDTVAVKRFEDKGGRFLRGHGRLVDPRTVEVDGIRYQARDAVVVATGAVAAMPPIPGLDSVTAWTNREAIATATVPSSLIVLGGGAIGVELGQVFARFGCAVSIVEAEDRLLSQEEPEASRVLRAALESDGIDVRTGVSAASVAPHGDGVRAELSNGDSVHGAELLVATGRRVDLAGIAAANIGADESARSLPVDNRMRVTDGVWAVGDVTGEGAFTHVAMYQAKIAIADILGRPWPSADYRALPRCDLHRPRGRRGRTDRGGGPQRGHKRERWHRRRGQVGKGLDPQSRKRWRHQIGRRLGPECPRRRYLGGTDRWRGARVVGAGDPRGHTALGSTVDDLRVPDVPPGCRGRPRGPFDLRPERVRSEAP